MKIKINRKTRNILNEMSLKLFIMFVFITLLIRMIISIFFDLGFYKNKFNQGFFNDPQTTFALDYQDFLVKNPGANWEDFLDSNPYLSNLVRMHPHLFWNLTQFTWITTLFLLLVLVFRYLATKEKIPESLKWISRQETFSLATMYEVVVMVVYWSWIFNHGLLTDPISILELVNSIIVHTLIPVLIVIYAILYALFNEKVTIVKFKYTLIGMIYPTGYFFYYVIISLIWNDPYPISQIQKHNFSQTNGIDLDQEAYKILYLGPISLFGIYASISLFTFTHNFIIKKWNWNTKKALLVKKEQSKI